MSDYLEQEARNETIFRDMNEWTQDANDALARPGHPMDAYLCECSDRLCSQPISLTRSEYEAVRAVAVRFAIALNHENPEIDRVIFENERFATVEKFYGVGAKIARATNPRGYREEGGAGHHEHDGTSTPKASKRGRTRSPATADHSQASVAARLRKRRRMR